MKTRLQDKRVWLAGGIALAVIIVTIGWLMAISPQRSSTNTLRGEADAALSQNTLLAAKVAKLKRQNENVGELKTTLRAALAALPFDTGLPTFTRQVAGQASRNKVSLTSISVGSVAATAAAPAPTTSTGTTGTGTTGTGTTGTGTTGTGTAGTGTTGAPAVATAVVAIPITLLSSGTSAHQLAFLKAIQVDGPRRALVSSTTLGGGASAGGGPSIDKSSTMTTQLTIFTAPLSAAGRAQLAKLLSAK